VRHDKHLQPTRYRTWLNLLVEAVTTYRDWLERSEVQKMLFSDHMLLRQMRRNCLSGLFRF